jgi:hypothetical protein
LNLYLENDTTATNYYSNSCITVDATVGAQNKNFPMVSYVTVNSAFTEIYLTRCADGKAHFIATTSYESSAGHAGRQQVTGYTSGTIANITRIALNGDAANSIGAGSKLTIFGVG